MYMYMYMYMCVCVYICECERPGRREGGVAEAAIMNIFIVSLAGGGGRGGRH